MKINNKAKLAFDMLEKEMTLLSIDELNGFMGGEGPNGYCLFNAMNYYAERYKGTLYEPDDLFEKYKQRGVLDFSGQRRVTYASPTSSGILPTELLSVNVNVNNRIALEELASIGVKAYGIEGATSSERGQGILTALGRGDTVMTSIISGGPNGVQVSHDIIITGRDAFGQFLYIDPTEDSNSTSQRRTLDLLTYSIDFTMVVGVNRMEEQSTGTTFDENPITQGVAGSTGLFSITQDNNGDWIQNFYYYDPTDPQYLFQWDGNQVPESSGYLGYSTGYKNMTTDTYFDVSTGDEAYYISTGNYSTGNESTGNSTGNVSTGDSTGT